MTETPLEEDAMCPEFVDADDTSFHHLEQEMREGEIQYRTDPESPSKDCNGWLRR